jgi:hypothetical protein
LRHDALHRAALSLSDDDLRARARRAYVSEFQQVFWKCEHHPIATENFFRGTLRCEWFCHSQELMWYHSGFSPTPPMWAAKRANSL